MRVAFALADLLAAQPAYQTLCNETTTAAARQHVTVGIVDAPVDGNRFAIDELANKGMITYMRNPPDTPLYILDGVVGEWSANGSLLMYHRRIVRTGEDLQDVFKWFWGWLCKLEEQLIAAIAAADCPRALQARIVRNGGPEREQIGEEVAQGAYLWAEHTVEWGDAISD